MSLYISKLEIMALLSEVGGLSALVADSMFTSSVNQLCGPSGTKIIAAIGIVSVVARKILQVIHDQPDAPPPVIAPAPLEPIIVVPTLPVAPTVPPEVKETP
jgi:hypothetical protein